MFFMAWFLEQGLQDMIFRTGFQDRNLLGPSRQYGRTYVWMGRREAIVDGD